MITADKLSPLSKEQYDFLINSNARINIAHGPVRSGKNFIENVRLLKYLISEPMTDPKSPIAFCGASTAAIYEIFLSDLFDMIGQGNYTYNEAKGSGSIYGRNFQCFPCQKAGDFKRLRGRTLGGALITEGTLCDKDFLNEILARLSVKGSMLFIDTNPDGPFHWLYTEFICNQNLIDKGMLKAFHFNFDSNLSLADEYKDALKEFYGPGTLWYKRMIEGLWVMADGVIYSGFNQEKHVIEPRRIPYQTFDTHLNFGMDYGTSNPFAGLMGGCKDGVWYIFNEMYYDGRERGQLSDHEYADRLTAWMGDYNLRYAFIDPSAASMKTELRKHSGFKATRCRIKDADNTVLDGIAFINSLLATDRLKIAEDCKNLLREMGSYVWCPNAAKRGEDKPKKENDHLCDAMRYLIFSQTKKTNIKASKWLS